MEIAIAATSQSYDFFKPCANLHLQMDLKESCKTTKSIFLKYQS
jgi:hypothetical protein